MKKVSKPQKIGRSDNELSLAGLSRTLKELLEENILTQSDIEAATGVDQTTISRAKNGRLDRVTEKVRRLKHYADMRMQDRDLPEIVKKEASIFLAAGGSEKELISSIRYATRLVLRRRASEEA